MNSKLKILLVIFSLVLVIVIGNQHFLKLKTISSSINNKEQELSDCCQKIKECCEDTNAEVVKCFNCNINEKPSNLFNPVKFNLPFKTTLKYTTVAGTQNKAPSYFYKDAFFIQQNNFSKNLQLDRPWSYPYLENIHTTLLLI